MVKRTSQISISRLDLPKNSNVGSSQMDIAKSMTLMKINKAQVNFIVFIFLVCRTIKRDTTFALITNIKNAIRYPCENSL